jgi:hypothetical protein
LTPAGKESKNLNMRTYRDWEEAAKNSRKKWALGPPVMRNITTGQRCPVQIIKPLTEDAFFTYAGCPGLKVEGMKPAAREIDSVTAWRPF